MQAPIPSRAHISPTPFDIQSIRSDDLPHFAAILQRIALFKDHMGLYRIDLIVDANVVIRDLLWLAKKRTNPTARTELMELMDCDVVRAHAPYYLIREIKVNLPEVALEQRVALGKLLALWKQYRKRIRLVPVGGPPKQATGIRDPKDVPYLRLQKKLSYPIASEDPDLPAMGANVVRIQIFAPLRAYSRSAAIEYHLKVAGFGSMIMVGVAIQTAITLLRNVRSLPKWMVWGGVLLLVLALANPKGRERIFKIASEVFQGGALLLEGAFELIWPMVERHALEQTKAALHLTQAKAAVVSGPNPVAAVPPGTRS